ncbi:DNA-binding transcriptional regulator, AcrR family [Thermomonospora echinospora]|uniref:DNA-binding transcriptional regulator, AcrR family n=1 Tax=Thermomonospora echinospora TaxID=1992 RepID=A0A1H5Z3D2_9ACTN|nr:TetR/AcrR family transcriptional regulator [Thermomonospora echinospora]SEG30674.1 DNA-binding transcriptional regulator, AcrR family [Thermomonospora echinospora]
MRLEQTSGRPAERPKRDRAATRRRLLEAARDLFSEHGYDQVTVRMIAGRAGANVALVNRYFGSKSALFGEVLASESVLPHVLEGGTADLPRRLAEHVMRQTHPASASPVSSILDRSQGNPEIQPIIRRHLERVLIDPLTGLLDGPDARLRATAAAFVLLGSGSVRRVLGLADLHEADPAELTDRLITMFEAALAPRPLPTSPEGEGL